MNRALRRATLKQGGVVEEAGGGTGSPVPPPVVPPTPPAPAPATSAFTAEQQTVIDQLIGREKSSAERNRVKALLSELGFDKLEDLKATVEAKRDADKAAMTEAERAKAEADAVKATYEGQLSALAAERHSLTLERALAAAGAQGDLAKVSKLVDVEVGADTAAVQAAVEATKAQFAALFGAATATPAPSEPSGGGAPSRPSSSPDAKTRGEDIAKRYEAGQRSNLR